MKIAELLHKQNNNLDLMRIVLASLVIVGHAPYLNGEDGFWVDPVRYFFPFTYSGALAVKLFFFISGLVVTNSYLYKRDAAYFVVSRTFRIIPAMLLVLLATVFIFAPLMTQLPLADYFSSLDHLAYIRRNLVFNTDYFLPGLFTDNVYPLAVNGSLWSLRYEMACYLVLLVVFVVLGKRNKYWLNIPILLIVIDAFLPRGFFVRFLGDNPEVNVLPISFAIGALFAVNAEKIRISLVAVVVAVAVLWFASQSPLAEVLLVIAGCLVLTYLCANPFVLKLKPKYDISYGIYLWGFLVQQTLFQVIGHQYVAVHCLIALIITVVLAVPTNLLVEKPFIEYGRRFFKFYGEKRDAFFRKSV